MDLHQTGMQPEEIQKAAKIEVGVIAGEAMPGITGLIAPLEEKQKTLMTNFQVLQLAKQMNLKYSVAIMDLGERTSGCHFLFCNSIFK